MLIKERSIHYLLLLAVLMGFTSFIVQLVMIREFLSLFMGNELVIGIILSLWMLLTAGGALLGKSVNKTLRASSSFVSLLLFIGLSPVSGLLFVNWLQSQLFDPGVLIPLQFVLIITLAGIALFCLASGIMFTILATHYKKAVNGRISKVYMLEALGSLAGGLLFNLVLIHTLSAINILHILILLNLIAAGIYLFISGKRKLGILSMILSFAAIIVLLQLKLDKVLIQMKYPGQEVLLNRDTPFAKLVITKNAGQITFYHNGIPAFNTSDLINREEKIHYAMPLHPSPENILLMGGGIDGSAKEILKYEVRLIDYVDADQWSMAAAEKFNILTWPEQVNIHKTDLKRFLSDSKRHYDMIILNPETPGTIGNSRFFTSNFFGLAKQHLQDNGILSIRLPGSTNYLDESFKNLFSSIYKSLESHFDYIRIIAGNNTYFLASNSSLDGNIPQLIERKKIPTEYVNQYYLDNDLILERSRLIEKQLLPDVRPNTYAQPVVSFILSQRWLQMMNIPIWTVSLIPLLLMLILLFMLPPIKLGLFTTGFTASAAEFLLLIAFQITYGFIYQMAGLIIMLFMAGLAAGSGYFNRFIQNDKSSFIKFQMLLGILTILMPLLIIWSSMPALYYLAGIIIGLLTFVTGIITGIQYHLSTSLSKGDPSSVAASTYGADLAGSAFGIFFIALFIYPLAGLYLTGIFLAAINFAAAARLRIYKI